MQYLLNIQRQLGSYWLLEAGYLGSEGHHLQGFQDPNQAPPGTNGSAASRLPFKDFGVIQLVQNGSNGSYNSLTAKATRRFHGGLSLVSSYTWAKSIDETSGIRDQAYDNLFPQNSYCDKCERGLSTFDVRSRFVTSLLYDLPVGRGRRLNISNPVLNTLIGGWQAGGIITAETGVPATATIGGVDNANTGEGGDDRANTTGVSPYTSNPTPSRYYNLAAFVEAPAGQFGTAGRNTLEGPPIFNCDFEVHKDFHMPYKESHVLQFRLEAFNGLNHPNWTQPNNNVLAGAAQPGLPTTAAHLGFGVVSSTSTNMRQIQLGLKYSF